MLPWLINATKASFILNSQMLVIPTIKVRIYEEFSLSSAEFWTENLKNTKYLIYATTSRLFQFPVVGI